MVFKITLEILSEGIEARVEAVLGERVRFINSASRPYFKDERNYGTQEKTTICALFALKTFQIADPNVVVSSYFDPRTYLMEIYRPTRLHRRWRRHLKSYSFTWERRRVPREDLLRADSTLSFPFTIGNIDKVYEIEHLIMTQWLHIKRPKNLITFRQREAENESDVDSSPSNFDDNDTLNNDTLSNVSTLSLETGNDDDSSSGYSKYIAIQIVAKAMSLQHDRESHPEINTNDKLSTQSCPFKKKKRKNSVQ